jgi:ATP-dependent DNA helicase RecG
VRATEQNVPRIVLRRNRENVRPSPHRQPETGKKLLELDEDQWFDRKSIRIAPRDLAKTEIALANADGGTLVVGLHGGRIEGLQGNTSKVNDLVQAALDHAVPPIRARHALLPCIRSDGVEDELLVLDIEPSDQVHANVRDEVFLRVGDEDRKLTFAQRQELVFDRGQASFESRAVPGTTLDAVDSDLVLEYTLRLGANDPERMLHARGLAIDDQLTVAGTLLFASLPQRFMPEAFVRVIRYRGTERGVGAGQQISNDIRVEGPIPRQITEARRAIVELQPTRRALIASEGRFGPVPLVPEEVWLEGLVNAVVHRSYSLSGDHIRVEIFDDRIEVTSPGRFPGIVSLTHPLDAPRFARNPHIARVCADLAFGQELGEGLRRMFNEMRLAGLQDPEYRQTPASVQVILSTEPVNRALDAQLAGSARAIIQALRDSGGLSTGEVAEVIGVSAPTALKRLRLMANAGMVVWSGKSKKDPRASWVLPPM